MRVLGIDTATWTASVGIVEAGSALAECSRSAAPSHGVFLLPLVLETLAAAGLAMGDLEGVAVSAGPGSFTGLRIGLSTAKGLALARRLPLVGVPTLQALAEVAGVAEGRLVCPLLDARKQEVYAALFRLTGGVLRPVVPARAVPLPSWLGRIDEPCTFIGDAAASVPHAMPARHAWTVLPFEKFHPRGTVVARLGSERLERGEADDTGTLEPFYVRPPEAELTGSAAAGGYRAESAQARWRKW